MSTGDGPSKSPHLSGLATVDVESGGVLELGFFRLTSSLAESRPIPTEFKTRRTRSSTISFARSVCEAKRSLISVSFRRWSAIAAKPSCLRSILRFVIAIEVSPQTFFDGRQLSILFGDIYDQGGLVVAELLADGRFEATNEVRFARMR